MGRNPTCPNRPGPVPDHQPRRLPALHGQRRPARRGTPPALRHPGRASGPGDSGQWPASGPATGGDDVDREPVRGYLTGGAVILGGFLAALAFYGTVSLLAYWLLPRAVLVALSYALLAAGIGGLALDGLWTVAGRLSRARRQRRAFHQATVETAERLVERFERLTAQGRHEAAGLPDTWGPVPGVTEHTWYLVRCVDDLLQPVKVREHHGWLYTRPFTPDEWRSWATAALPRRQRRTFLARVLADQRPALQESR